MIWRESLPARVALATAGLLAVILLAVTAASYVITALLLRQAVDSTLLSSLQQQSEGRPERRYDDDDDRPLPPAWDAPESITGRDGRMYVSLVYEDGVWRPRTEPNWWQVLAPAEDELRVLYARGERGRVLRATASLKSAHDVLPSLLRNLMLLSAVGVIMSAAIAWRMAGRTYRPLQAVIATAQDISAQSLSVRVPDAWHDRTLRQLIGVLNAMIGRLQSAFEAQGRFVAAAAHELRGPLGAMRAELEVTLRRERAPAEYKAALEGALAETARLSIVAEHLLTLARGGAMARELAIPVHALLERVAGDVQRSAGGDVTVSAPPDLTVDGDSLALERLLSNLARNGVEAGGAPVSMSARAVVGGGVEIVVRDVGRGIPREALPHIFEPFYRADPARGRDGGTGLGLAIVKAIIDAHGGRITVESAPGAGTTFTVWLPGAGA